MTDKFMLNGHIIATAFQIEGGKYFARDATKSNYILLQCQGYLSNEQYAILDPLQVIALQYIDIHTYLCRYEPSDLDIIRSLPFVVSATVFHQDIVTNARLKSKSQRRSTTEQQAPHAQSLAAQTDPGNQSSTPTTEGLSDQLLDVNIVLHPLSDRTTGEIKQHIVETLQYSPDAIQTSDHAIRMILKVHDLDAIAGIDEIQTIEEVPELQAHSNFARRDLRIPKVRSTPIEFTGLTQNALDGVGQTVCVADSGFDIGLQGDAPGEVPSRPMFTGIFGSNNRISIDSQLVPANLRAGPSLVSSLTRIVTFSLLLFPMLLLNACQVCNLWDM
jgi:serine protease AprX